MSRRAFARWITHPLSLQIMRFATVGLLAAIIHFSIVIGLVQAGLLTPLYANVFGFTVAFQASYWGHRLWTFHLTEKPHLSALPKLFLIQIVNFTLNESIFFIFLNLHIPYPLALFLVLTILPIFTFTLSKCWVF